jgi:hypothetical protein
LDQALTTTRRVVAANDGAARCRGGEDNDVIFWLVLGWVLIGLVGAFYGEA